jgi:hypothetical protein
MHNDFLINYFKLLDFGESINLTFDLMELLMWTSTREDAQLIHFYNLLTAWLVLH